MCFGGQPAPQDNSAAVARQQEVARQANITAGQGKINDAFGAFNPEYFSGFQKAYTDHYNPQVDQQFADSRRNLKYDIARAGTQDSTPGQYAFGRLAQAYGDKRTEVAANAVGATDNLRNQVDQQKTALFNQNNTAADPSLAAQNAVSAAGSLMTPQSFSPLASLFNGVAGAGAQYIANQNNRLPPGYGSLFAPGVTSGGGSAGRVVK